MTELGAIMFMLIGLSFGVLLTAVATVWLGSLTRDRTRVVKRHPRGDW